MWSSPGPPWGKFPQIVLFFVDMYQNNRKNDKFGKGPNDRNSQQQQRRSKVKVVKKDPLFVDGVKPRPMYVDYKDLDLLSKLTNRHGKIVSRRKSGCHAASQHAVARAIKRARFMALLPYVGD
jgi:small subunit ribosomal protein S18